MLNRKPSQLNTRANRIKSGNTGRFARKPMVDRASSPIEVDADGFPKNMPLQVRDVRLPLASNKMLTYDYKLQNMGSCNMYYITAYKR